MFKRVYGICTLVALSLFLFNCGKRPFATIEIKGRVLNFWDKTPVPCEIRLFVHSSRDPINFGNSNTNTDGTFDLKSNAQWDGNNYILDFIPTSGLFSSFERFYSINRNQSINLGDIHTGLININCNVTLNSTSGASISFKNPASFSQNTFTAGTNTVVAVSQLYDSTFMQTSSNSFRITYRLSSSTADSNINIPLQPPATTCSVTINY